MSSVGGSAHGVTGGGVLGGGGCLTMFLMCPSPSPGLPPSPTCAYIGWRVLIVGCGCVAGFDGVVFSVSWCDGRVWGYLGSMSLLLGIG